MSIFGFPQATAVAAWTAVGGFQVGGGASAGGFHQTYLDNAPMWATEFAIACSYIMGSIVLGVTGFYFTYVTTPDSWQLILGLIMLLVHMMLRKLWHPLLFHGGVKCARSAMNLSFWMFLTAVGFVCAAWINANNSLWWVPLVTFAVYLIFFWAGGLYLNLRLLYPGSWSWDSGSHYDHPHSDHHHSRHYESGGGSSSLDYASRDGDVFLDTSDRHRMRK